MHHFRKTRKVYTKRNKDDETAAIVCTLCNAVNAERSIAENEAAVVVRNRVAYDVFEGYRTTGEHYMVLPKKHRESFNECTDEEKLGMMNLIAQFENVGFNIYARGKGNPNRSQPHQHTHLIRLVDKPARFTMYIGKPYFVAHID